MYLICRFAITVKEGLDTNQLRCLPLSTVVLRWYDPTHRVMTGYDDSILYAVMARFGPIKGLEKVGRNEAFVVYKNLTDSCEPVRKKMLFYRVGSQDYQLYCHWYHKSMEMKTFYRHGGPLKVIHDTYII